MAMVTSAKRARHQELRRMLAAAQRDKNTGRFYQDLQEHIKSEKGNLEDHFSIQMLFEELVPDGRELIANFDVVNLQESSTAIDTGAFMNVFKSIAEMRALEEFDKPQYIGMNLVQKMKADNWEGDRLTGVADYGDDSEVVGESQPYPRATLEERFVDTPAMLKRGLIVDVTREAISRDRTGQVLRKVAKIADTLAISREKRILDMIFGIVTSFRENGNSPVATYQVDNTISNPLVDYTSFNAVQAKFDEFLNPTNGEPTVVEMNTVIVPKALEPLARMLQSATALRLETNSGSTQTYVPGNGLRQSFTVESSPYVKARTSSSSTWFAGDPKSCFAYMEYWPASVDKQGVSSELAFERDIFARFKVSEAGTPAVLRRDKMMKCTS